MAEHRRCVLCNCTDTEVIATHEEEYIPGLKFSLHDERDYICSVCEDAINEIREGYEEDDDLVYVDFG